MENAAPLGASAVAVDSSNRQPPTRWPIEILIPIAFAIAVLAIGASTALVWKSLAEFRDSSQLVTHTHEVLTTIERLYSRLNQAIALMREYVITGNTALLTDRDHAITDLDATIKDVQRLTSDNPTQHQRVSDLTTLVRRRVATMISLQAVQEKQGFEAARAFMIGGASAELTMQIRAKLDQMAATENTLLTAREQKDQDSNRNYALCAVGLLAVVSITVFIAFFRVWRELSARRQLALQLDESRRFFQSVFENIPNMVFIKSARDFRYVAFNTAAEQLMGHSRAEVIGKTDFDLMPEKHASELARREREIIASGQTADIAQEKILNPAGEERVMHTRKAVITNPDGTAKYLVGISEDITDRVRTEQYIQSLNDQLQGKAGLLEVANKELESFCYSVSHDLRAPLRAVNSYALMLEEDHSAHLDDEAKRFIRVIREGANRMGRLIEDLLAFSRIGRTPMKLERLDLNALVSRAASEVLEHHDGAKPKLAIHELPPARGDPALIYQVWSNLIGNAVKYSSKVTTPRIEIGGVLNGSEVEYYVKDNGAGFNMRYINKLFGVFQRLHGQEEFPGTGVGLAIVHRIITRHGGRIWAEGEPGKGATFSFTLPRGETA